MVYSDVSVTDGAPWLARRGGKTLHPLILMLALAAYLAVAAGYGRLPAGLGFRVCGVGYWIRVPWGILDSSRQGCQTLPDSMIGRRLPQSSRIVELYRKNL
jgi:hypothetical protein